jgi:hypothetical protein
MGLGIIWEGGLYRFAPKIRTRDRLGLPPYHVSGCRIGFRGCMMNAVWLRRSGQLGLVVVSYHIVMIFGQVSSQEDFGTRHQTNETRMCFPNVFFEFG